ncbi:MAG: hypothetical protein ACFFC3_10740 [Candidatus Odinarchaeota archaeon]
MKINNINDEFELEFYLKIVDFFQKENTNSENKEIWKNKSIIELMNLLKQTQDYKFIANALILLLSLFEHEPPDLYANRGYHINNISEKDKRILISELKNEFLSN